MQNEAKQKQAAAKEKAVKIPADLQAEIKKWTAKHGKVRKMAVVSNDKSKVVCFRLPTREELSASENLATNEDGEMDMYAKANKMMTDTYLGGELTLEEILDDVEVYMPVARMVLYELVEQKKTIWIDS